MPLSLPRLAFILLCIFFVTEGRAQCSSPREPRVDFVGRDAASAKAHLDSLYETVDLAIERYSECRSAELDRKSFRSTVSEVIADADRLEEEMDQLQRRMDLFLERAERLYEDHVRQLQTSAHVAPAVPTTSPPTSVRTGAPTQASNGAFIIVLGTGSYRDTSGRLRTEPFATYFAGRDASDARSKLETWIADAVTYRGGPSNYQIQITKSLSCGRGWFGVVESAFNGQAPPSIAFGAVCNARSRDEALQMAVEEYEKAGGQERFARYRMGEVTANTFALSATQQREARTEMNFGENARHGFFGEPDVIAREVISYPR